MTEHLQGTLLRLADGRTSGFHFGSLKALVARGLAATRRGEHGTEYVITDTGRKVAAEIFYRDHTGGVR